MRGTFGNPSRPTGVFLIPPLSIYNAPVTIHHSDLCLGFDVISDHICLAWASIILPNIAWPARG